MSASSRIQQEGAHLGRTSKQGNGQRHSCDSSRDAAELYIGMLNAQCGSMHSVRLSSVGPTRAPPAQCLLSHPLRAERSRSAMHVRRQRSSNMDRANAKMWMHLGGLYRAHIGLLHAGQRVLVGLLAVLPCPEPVEQARQVHGHEEDAGLLWVKLAARARQEVLMQLDVNCTRASARQLSHLLAAYDLLRLRMQLPSCPNLAASVIAVSDRKPLTEKAR